MFRNHFLTAPCLLAILAAVAPPIGVVRGAEEAKTVRTLRVPEGGIQPQVVRDGKGTIHLVYFRGVPANGNLFYVHSSDGIKFTRPIQVNSRADSAIAVGNIRGAQLAIGKNGRVHVAWNGSGKAEPKAARDATPMLYTRLNDEGTAFEPQRNVIQSAVGLDGGGSVAADEDGNVYVAWHAPTPGVRGEENRRVWLARSSDEGKTFAREQAVSEEGTGACGCCGLRVFTDRNGMVYLLYRSATDVSHRDTYLLFSKDHGARFQSDRVQKWDIESCPMSSFALAESKLGTLAAWETAGQVSFARIDPATGKRSEAVAAPGAGKGRKHPVVAANAQGEVLLAWTDGMGWNRGGAVAWQLFDKDGQPTAEKGHVDGVPVWGLVAVFARPDGGFTVVY